MALGDSESLNIIINAKDRASKVINTVQGKMERAGQKMQSMGQSMTMGMTAPITAGIGAAVNEFSKFEDAMVEVEKVTNPDTAKEMDSAIKDMSQTIPLARTELANITADAGRFGIEGTKNIKSFTETVSKMTIATDLSAQEAGEAFAKLGELTGTPTEKVGNLGSAINELSNNAATSAGEITDNMLRSSASLSQLGLSNTQMVALSGTMNEVSDSSERAGTRLRSFAQSMMDPGKASDVAGALDMNVDKFKELRDENPAGMIQELAEIMETGGAKSEKLRGALDNISTQVLSALGPKVEDFGGAMSLTAEQFEKNTSLEKEFEAASDTLSSKLKIMMNQLKNAGDTIVKALLPYIEKAVKWIRDMGQKFEELSPSTQKFIAIAGVLAAALGPILMILGGIASGIATLLSPVGIIIGLFAALAAGTAYLIANWDRISQHPVVQKIWGILKPLLKAAGEAFKDLGESVMKLWKAISPVLLPVLKVLGAIIGGVIMGAIAALTGAVKLVAWQIDQWAMAIENTKKIAKIAWEAIKSGFISLKDGLVAAIQKMKAVWDKIWGGIKATAMAIVKFITGSILLMLDKFFPGWQERLNKIINFFKKIFGAMKQFTIEIWTGIKEWLNKYVKEKVGGAIEKGLNWIKNTWEGMWNGIKDFMGGVMEGIKNKIKGPIEWIKEKIQSVMDPIKNIGGAIKGWAGSAGDAIGGFADKAMNRSPFQHGGIVPGPIGTPQPIMAHGQEKIIPANRSEAKGGGGNVNVTISNIQVGSSDDIPKIREQVEEAFRSLAINNKISP